MTTPDLRLMLSELHEADIIARDKTGKIIPGNCFLIANNYLKAVALPT